VAGQTPTVTVYQQQELLVRSGRVFSPGAPIDQRDLFAGRMEQIERVVDAVNSRGQHVVVYGERGVGKTSLANILKDLFSGSVQIVVKVNCDRNDDYSCVWHKLASEIEVVESKDTFGFAQRSLPSTRSLDDNLTKELGPDDIRKCLQYVGESIVIFDEFDRIEDARTPELFSDTIKTLSDNSINSTIVLVGVADVIDELIAEHASIDRSLMQIQMPRMNTEELREIVEKAHEKMNMRMERNARDLIVLLSQGLPHYTHLLALHATKSAIHDMRRKVTMNDLQAGLESALENTQQSVIQAYRKATASQRKDTIFEQVLLACALADADELGYFVSADVREPLSKIMGKPYEIPGFSQHLNKFSDEKRGDVLQKTGTTRRFRFRFTNPLLQPYVIMRGLKSGVLVGDLMRLLKDRRSS